MGKDDLAKSSDTSIEKEGFISQSLSKDGVPNQSLPDDHIGVENISVELSEDLAKPSFSIKFLQYQ